VCFWSDDCGTPGIAVPRGPGALAREGDSIGGGRSRSSIPGPDPPAKRFLDGQMAFFSKGTSKKKTASKRELIDTGRDKRYVRRHAEGQFKESDDVGRSLSQDRKRNAKTVAKPGQGDKEAEQPKEEELAGPLPPNLVVPAPRERRQAARHAGPSQGGGIR
jgi:hypothetical protein